MTSFSMRALLPVSILIGLSSACAHRNTAASDAPPPSPAPPSTSTPNSTLTSAEIAKAHAQPVMHVLMARFPGVEVIGASTGADAARSRDGTALVGGDCPLLVVHEA